MSLLRWFSRQPDPEAAPSSHLRDSRLPAAESRRSERSARRERLYAVVRQTMSNAGVLSSSYRFKVLSLDGRGRQFLVMVDLTDAPGGGTAELGRVEAAMQQSAKAQHGIVVKAVYWREVPRAGAAQAAGPGVPQARSGAGAAQPQAVAPAAAAVAASETPDAGGPVAGGAEPLLAEEIAAFRQALAQGSERPVERAPRAGANRGPQSYTLLTGFEDTEIRAPGLSNTQHGDLH